MVNSSLLRIFSFSLVSTLLLTTCTKNEEVLVTGNKALPDNTIENVIKENYVNKLYINLLGRKPNDTEYAAGLAQLNQNNLSKADRQALINVVLSNMEYWKRTDQLARDELLSSADSMDIELFIFVFNVEISMTMDSVIIKQYLELIARLELMHTVEADLASGLINIIGMHRRYVYNSVYDDINMGTVNFIVSMYENLLFREPTDEELIAATPMVNGTQSIIFLKIGSSKTDFIDILLGAREYYEGQVRNLYLRYLFREPLSEEMAAAASTYEANKDYAAIQISILSSDEYVGL